MYDNEVVQYRNEKSSIYIRESSNVIDLKALIKY